jgi:hypothetical protein
VAKQIANGKLEVTIHNPANGTLAFFNRISLVNEQTGKRILPVFYSDNYISVFPGQQKTITLEYTPSNIKAVVSVSGWNVKEQSVPIE